MSQHYVGIQRDRGIFSNCVNTLNHYRVMRALILAFDRWVRDGIEPPPDEYDCDLALYKAPNEVLVFAYTARGKDIIDIPVGMNGLNWMPLMILSVYGVLDSRVLLTLTHSPPTLQRSDYS